LPKEEPLVFWKYTNMYYDYSALNTYVGVDPGKQTGEMVMDAGRAYFSDGTQDTKTVQNMQLAPTFRESYVQLKKGTF